MARRKSKKKPKKNYFTAKVEALVVQLLGEAVDLLDLIALRTGQRECHYLLDSLFLILREMGYFFTYKTSPLFTRKGFLTVQHLTAQQKRITERIKNIRDAIGHRGSEVNFLRPRLKVVGAMNFKNGDVEIQYGRIRIFLIRDVLSIHRRYRELFSNSKKLTFLSRHPAWAIEERKLSDAENLLAKKLADPRELMKLR